MPSAPCVASVTCSCRPRSKQAQRAGKTLFAVSAAALIVACVAGWAITNTQVGVAEAATVQVNTFEMMKTTKQMPSEHFVDFSFVY